MSTDLPSQIHSELNELDAQEQRQVLEFVRNLKQPQQGMTGAELKKFAGLFSSEDAKSMVDAIESGCEQVDPDGW